jgi:tRNA modification GTPase
VIDFGPDENIEDSTIDFLLPKIKELKREIGIHLDDNHRGEQIRNGSRVVLVGEPNSGKSSLYNLLLDADQAIVTSVPGTTRDLLHTQCRINGNLIHLTDTAGIHEATNEVEKIGIEKTKSEFARSDLVVLVLDAGVCRAAASRNELAELVGPFFDFAKHPDLVVLNKSDLLMSSLEASQLERDVAAACRNVKIVLSSCINNEVEKVVQVLDDMVRPINDENQVFLTRQRHRTYLERVRDRLERFEQMYNNGAVELAAEELRQAVMDIAAINGHVTVDEHVLNVIFSDFCIGK